MAHAGADTVVCYNQPAFLSGTSSHTSGAVTNSWIDTVGLSTPGQATTTYLPPADTSGFVIKTLVVEDQYGCNFRVTDQVKISIEPPVPAFAGNDTLAVYNSPHMLMGSGGTQYSWTPAAPLNNPFTCLLYTSPSPRD